MTTFFFCGQYIVNGEDDSVEDQMDVFINAKVDFEKEMAEYGDNVKSWRQKSTVSVNGLEATKKTVRHIKLKTGEEEFIIEKSQT